MYVDGFVLPVFSDKIDAYREMATHAGKIWMEHGALAYRECVLDTTDKPHDFCATFPQLVQPKGNETIAFAYILYRDKAHRDEVNAKVMADERMKDGCDPNAMPFEVNRMAFGGFKALVSLGDA